MFNRIWFLAGTEISFFSALSRPVLGPTQPYVYWEDFPQGYSSHCVNLTTDLHLVLNVNL